MIDSLNHIAGIWWNWMWATTWQVSLLIIFIAVVDLAIRKWAWPQVRYALWLMVVVKLVLPPTFYLPTSITAQFFPAAIEEVRQAVTPSLSMPVNPSTNVPRTSVTTTGARTVTRHLSATVESTSLPSEAASLQGPRQPPRVALSALAYALLIWSFCVLILAAYLMLRLGQLRRQALSDTEGSLPPWLPQLLAETSARLKLRSLPRVLVSRHTASPAVLGVFRPVLLLPQDSLAHLSPQKAKHVLLHELAHIKRGDLIIHAVYLLVQVIFWFNPLLWIVRRQLQHLRELCCDATVANVLRENTPDYRQTLLETARELLAKPAADPGLGLLGIGEHGNCLRERLRWLERNTWKHAGLRKAVTVLTATLVFVGVLPMATAQIGLTTQASFPTVGGGASQSANNDASQPAGDKERFQTLIRRLHDAVLQDDRGAAAGILSDNQRVGSVIEEMKEAIELGATPAAVQTVVMREERALVITDFFQFADSRYRGKQCLVFTMLHNDDEWLVDDIDLESVQGLVQTVRRFDGAKSRAFDAHHGSLGLQGFCPVTLVDKGTWLQGDPRWGAVHKGRTYLFASREHQQRFMSQPDSFAPALAGCDPVVYVESGVFTDGKRQHGLWYKDEYFLFLDDASRTKFEADTPRYLRAIAEVDSGESSQAGPLGVDEPFAHRGKASKGYARWLSAAEEDSPSAFEKLVREVIESRKAIQRGRVEYTEVTTGRANSIMRYTVWFDGQSRRVDRQSLGDKVSTTIVTPDYYVSGHRGKPANVSRRQDGPEKAAIPDPLRFGLIPWFGETATQFEYEEFLLNPARKNVQVEIGSIGQEPVWEVSYHMPAKGQNDGQLVAVEYTLSPSKGNLPLRIVTRFTDQNGTTYRKSIDCELEQFPSGNVWFPARIAFRIESDAATDEQVLTVKNAHFNDPIDDDIFLGKGLFDVQ